MNERIEIRISKTKLVLLCVGCIVFVGICIWILTGIETGIYEKIIAIAGILFFGFGFVLFVFKSFNSSTGLIIDKYGITDYITRPRVGTIEWRDISHTGISEISSCKMLLIYVHDPEKYLNKLKGVNIQGLRNNYKMMGTPFVIPPSILNMKLEKLKMLIDEEMIKNIQK